MLLSDLPIGTKVADVNSKYNNKIIIWTVASKNHYGNNQVTLISDVLALKPSDAKETENSNSRNSYGNNRYSLSNIHSWLNSNKDNWYEAKHSLDAPPVSSLVTANPYDTEKGFCTNLSSKFLNKVKTTTITTALPTCDGGGSETISCKFFLPSLMEVGLGQENGISEGSQFPLFTDNASRIIEFGGASREWELRTPASNNGYDFRHIRPNGTNYTNVANNGYIGIRTVCNIDANIEVEKKSSYYELKLSNYLNKNASLSSALSVLENKKEITKQLRDRLSNILYLKCIEVNETDTLTTLIEKVNNLNAEEVITDFIFYDNGKYPSGEKLISTYSDSGTSLTEETENLYLQAETDFDEASLIVSTSSKKDLSNYTKLKISVKNYTKQGTSPGIFAWLAVAEKNNDFNKVAFTSIESNGEISVDITSLNAEYYCKIILNVDGTTTSDGMLKMRINKMWLE